jgi:hypothetical protein
MAAFCTLFCVMIVSSRRGGPRLLAQAKMTSRK